MRGCSIVYMFVYTIRVCARVWMSKQDQNATTNARVYARRTPYACVCRRIGRLLCRVLVGETASIIRARCALSRATPSPRLTRVCVKRRVAFGMFGMFVSIRTYDIGLDGSRREMCLE